MHQIGLAGVRHGLQVHVGLAISLGDDDLRHGVVLPLQDEVEHGGLIECVGHIGLGAFVQQELDHSFVAAHGRQIEGRLAVWRLGLHGRTLFDQRFDGVQIPFARRAEQVVVDVPGKQRHGRCENQVS